MTYFCFTCWLYAQGSSVAILTTVDENNHRLYAAEDIIPFYLERCPKINCTTMWSICQQLSLRMFMFVVIA